MLTTKKEQNIWLSDSQYRGVESLGLKEGFQSDIKIEKKFGPYKLKIAEKLEELLAAFTLRHQVFFEEGGAKSTYNSSLDMDEFDLVADHLILIDERTDELVGTYRLIRSDRTDSFYSQGEFNLGEILKLEGPMLELGRACVHKDYRNGATIALVWQGLGEYLKKTGTKWMFGCSSVEIDTIENAHGIGAELMKKHMASNGLLVEPLREHPKEELRFLKELNGDFTFLENSTSRFRIPPLLKGYLSAGAGVCGAPSYDPEFNSLDFFTLMDVEKMNPNFSRRFGVK